MEGLEEGGSKVEVWCLLRRPDAAAAADGLAFAIMMQSAGLAPLELSGASRSMWLETDEFDSSVRFVALRCFPLWR